MNKRNILITGGLGYLGGETVALLLKNKDNIVTVYDRGISGSDHMSSLFCDQLNVVIGDLRDKDNLKTYVDKADTVIHFAGVAGAPLVNRKPIEAYDTNIEGTKILASLVKKQRLLYASTGSVYGKVLGTCTEKTPAKPLSVYGEQKLLGEKILSDKGGVSLRLATVYGLSYKTRDDLYINKMIQLALVDKSVVLYEPDALRTFMHVQDTARAMNHFVDMLEIPDKVYNVGDQSLSYSKRQICELISKFIPFNIFEDDFHKDPDQRDYLVSYEKLLSTGFACKIRLEEKIQSMINYYESRFNSGYSNG